MYKIIQLYLDTHQYVHSYVYARTHVYLHKYIKIFFICIYIKYTLKTTVESEKMVSNFCYIGNDQNVLMWLFL